ncbi:SIS domain-containing protein, partial [Helicobacter aurati]|uniref:SIS domain-containing protein n=1 Tax=Helicobacter aurati TaxID=137778 RepID=UPI001FD46714
MQTLREEANALYKYNGNLDDLDSIVQVILQTAGKIAFIGVGKSGLVAQKIAATFSSTGTPSFFIHPTEAMHGDLGMLDTKDCVLAISYSGE